MKKSNLLFRFVPHFVPTLALAALLAAATGCATHNYQQGQKTSAALTAAAGKIDDTKARISAALAALNDLVNTPQGDLAPKYAQFNDAVNALQSSANTVDDKYNDLQKRGKRYFDEWDRQLATIQNADIRTNSATRKAAVMEKFTNVRRSYLQMQQSFTPFMSDLHDIQTALGTDLTQGGIGAVKSTAAKATQDAVPLNTSMTQLSSDFTDLGNAMSSSIPAPTPPPSTPTPTVAPTPIPN